MSNKNIKKVNSYNDLQYHKKELNKLQKILTDENEAESSKLHAPTPIRINSPSPILTKILNLPRPGSSEQSEKYDGDGLPPTTKSSRNRTPAKNKKKEIKEITPQRVNARDLPIALPQSVQTFTSLVPQAKRITTKFTKKSKGGKNKTKKRKQKKIKKLKSKK